MSPTNIPPETIPSEPDRSRAGFGIPGRELVIVWPAFWLVVLGLIPLLIVAWLSLSEAVLDRPPFIGPFRAGPEGQWSVAPNWANFWRLLTDPLYLAALIGSARIAGVATLVCLLIGYPMAWVMARATPALRPILLMAVIVPFLTSFVLRIYALMALLANKGVVNEWLIGAGWIVAPVQMLQTGFAVQVGVIYTYLPFMILPIYASLRRLDAEMLDAAADLGAGPLTRFFTLGVPLSAPGALAGSLLVFVPALGEVILPSLLAGPGNLMIGKVIWDEFFTNRDWPMAAAVSMALLGILLAAIIIFGKFLKDRPTLGPSA